MAPQLTQQERYLRRVESLALSALPIDTITVVASTETHHDGVMVALVPDAPESLAVNHPDALPANDLHITLCFLGKVQDLSAADKTAILAKARSVCDALGHSFNASADGVVVMGQNREGVPATALLVQSDDVVNLYENMAEALDYQSKYPSFIPHMTTGYGVPVEVAQEKLGQPIAFSNVLVKFGDARHVIPLTASIVAAPQTTNVIDRVIDSMGRLWDEALHPRDGEGKFIKKSGAISGKLSIPTADRRSVNTVDANRASVVGFKTVGNDVWVLAEVRSPDGSTSQGFAKASEVRAVAPVKARLDALYPVGNGDDFVDSSLERQRQLDLILAHINDEYGKSNDGEGALTFLETLGLTDDDLDYIYGGEDTSFLDGIHKVDRALTDEERDEQADIIADAKLVKTLRDRVHGLQSGTVESEIKSVGDLMDKYDKMNVSSFLSEKNGSITLSKVIVGEQEQGTGTAFMQDLIDYADSVNKRIDLTPSSDFGGSKKRLVEFYKRFGFVENKGRNRDLEVSEDMYRIPTPSSQVDTPDLDPHVAPTQKLIDRGASDQEAVETLRSGADPFTVQTANLLASMIESGRFDRDAPSLAPASSPIEWLTDPNDPTEHDAYLAGLSRSTTDRAYFVKESIMGAEFNNTDMVHEVLASLLSESAGEDGVKVPKVVFGDNAPWDGSQPDDDHIVTQPGHIVTQHGSYLVPSDWTITDMSAEQVSLQNDLNTVEDDLIRADMEAAFNEDMGNLYGNSVASMILLDYVTLNGDRNPGNALLTAPPTGGEGRVVPIDHGAAFDVEPSDTDDKELVSGDLGSLYLWFMRYNSTKAWRDIVRGGLDLNDNVTDASLRQAIANFVAAYENVTVEDIVARFSALPGVTETQIERVRSDMEGTIQRIEWLSSNQDAAFDGLTRGSTL